MRQRKGTQQVKPSGSPATKSNQSPSGMVLTIAFVAIGLVVLGLAYFVYLQYTNAIVVQNVQSVKRSSNEKKMYTLDELRKYDGEHGSKTLLLGIMGEVYDVSANYKTYGPDGSYHFFVGVDGSRAYVKGDFKNGLTTDVDDFTPEDAAGLQHWVEFFDKTYIHVGYIVGDFYNEDGTPTPKLLKLREKIEEGKRLADEEDKMKERYPSCNSKWSGQTQSGEVWCTDASGGVKRSWAGVPRQLHRPGKGTRCVCVDPNNEADMKDPNLKEYPNCNPKSSTCPIPKED